MGKSPLNGPAVLLLAVLIVPQSVHCGLVDMSHVLGNDTVVVPEFQAAGVQFVIQHRGYWTGVLPDVWLEANHVSFEEHVGTHLDAPAHTARGKWRIDDIPLENLICPAVVIDVTIQASRNVDYQLTVEDLQAWEAQYGRMPNGALVMLYSGWDSLWPDAGRYLGSGNEKPSWSPQSSNMHFPGFSIEAAEWLVANRKIGGIGTDAMCVDHGPALSFPVHVAVNKENLFIVENLRNVGKIPPVGAMVVVMPLTFKGGSGGPARVTAMWDEDDVTPKKQTRQNTRYVVNRSRYRG